MTIRRLQKTFAEKGWAILPLRLMVGFGFAAHGYAKLTRGPEHFAAILAAIGVPQPHIMAWVTSLVEFVGGTSLMVGAFVLPLTLPLALVMLTAICSVTWKITGENVWVRLGIVCICVRAVYRVFDWAVGWPT